MLVEGPVRLVPMGTESQCGSLGCGSDNFHRVGSIFDAPGGFHTDYGQRSVSCTGRNAWAWFTNGAAPFPELVDKRCSDGQTGARVSGGGAGQCGGDGLGNGLSSAVADEQELPSWVHLEKDVAALGGQPQVDCAVPEPERPAEGAQLV